MTKGGKVLLPIKMASCGGGDASHGTGFAEEKNEIEKNPDSMETVHWSSLSICTGTTISLHYVRNNNFGDALGHLIVCTLMDESHRRTTDFINLAFDPIANHQFKSRNFLLSVGSNLHRLPSRSLGRTVVWGKSGLEKKTHSCYVLILHYTHFRRKWLLWG